MNDLSTRALVLRAYHQVPNVRDVAAATGVSRTTVRQILIEAGARVGKTRQDDPDTSNKGRSGRPLTPNAMCRRWEDGEAERARKRRAARKAHERWLRAHGVEPVSATPTKTCRTPRPTTWREA